MKLGIWTPLPHALAPEPRLTAATRQAEAPASLPYTDEAFAFARDVVCRGEQLGYDITLIAERLLGPDLEAWMLSAALASVAPRIEIMTAVHPGLLAPQFVANMGASLDRISGGRFHLNLVPPALPTHRRVVHPVCRQRARAIQFGKRARSKEYP